MMGGHHGQLGHTGPGLTYLPGKGGVQTVQLGGVQPGEVQPGGVQPGQGRE
jgi:hypothetical protein